MADPISRADVEHVAKLSRLALTEDEIEHLTRELGGILGHADDIEALDLDDVAPTAHPLPLENVLRADEVRPSLDRDEVLAQAPLAEDRRFRVPRILGEAPCAFSLLGLGSFSRIEMSLCSDIDFAILVSDEFAVHHPYFKHFLSLLVHLRRGLPSNVLTIESKDLQTLFGQEKSLMHTPGPHCASEEHAWPNGTVQVAPGGGAGIGIGRGPQGIAE